MADKFNRFINTSGKTPEEIREEIKKLLSGAMNAVKTEAEKTIEAVDETVKNTAEDIRARINEIVSEASRNSEKTYSSQKIPPRGRENISYTGKKPQQLSADEIAFAPDRFPVKITDADRAMNEKIAEMRQRAFLQRLSPAAVRRAQHSKAGRIYGGCRGLLRVPLLLRRAKTGVPRAVKLAASHLFHMAHQRPQGNIRRSGRAVCHTLLL